MHSNRFFSRRDFLSFLLSVPTLLRAVGKGTQDARSTEQATPGKKTTGSPKRAAAPKQRHYYIAAEDMMWNYAPTGRDLLDGSPIPPPYAGHTRWEKTRFIEYTDETFTTVKPQPLWLGILGPVIRGEVGDSIKVHFLNRSKLAHNLHPHGLRYDKDSEGAHYLPQQHGAIVPPG